MSINEEFRKLRSEIGVLKYELELARSLLDQWIQMERDTYDGNRAYIDMLNETDDWLNNAELEDSNGN